MKSLQPIQRSTLSLLVLVTFSFAFVYAVGGASSRVMQSYHGLHHSAYVYQIVQGIVPPTNPSSLEMPANFYWAWHALLAVGVRILDVTPFEMSLLSNALGLAGFLCALWLATGQYTRNGWLRMAICVVPFCLLNPLGLAQFAGRIAGVWVPEILRGNGTAEVGLLDHLVSIARHHSSLQMVDQNLVQLFPRLGLFEGVMLSDRAGHLANKFLNFSSFPLALGFFATGQYLLVTLRGRPRARALGLVVAVFGMAVLSPLCAIAFGMTVFAFALIEGGRLFAASRAGKYSWSREDIEAIAAPLTGSGIGVLLALPLLLPVASAYRGEVLLLSPARGLWTHVVALGWALVPTALILGFALVRRSRLEPSAKVHALSATLYGLAALVLVAPLADPNEYKFVLLSVFPSSLLLLALVQSRSAEGENRGGERTGWIRAVTLALGTGGVVSISIMTLLYTASPWAASEPFVFAGATTRMRATDDRADLDLDAAYAWLRTSTPSSAYVFEAPVAKDDSLLPVIAQRRVVAQLASPFTRGIAHHERLLTANRALLRGIIACELDGSIVAALRAVPLRWPDELYALVEKTPGFTECDPESSAGFSPVYANASYGIYRIAAFSRQGVAPAAALPGHRVLFHGEHRAGGVSNRALGDTAEEHVAQATGAAGAHHDQIRVQGLREIRDARVRAIR